MHPCVGHHSSACSIVGCTPDSALRIETYHCSAEINLLSVRGVHRWFKSGFADSHLNEVMERDSLLQKQEMSGQIGAGKSFAGWHVFQALPYMKYCSKMSPVTYMCSTPQVRVEVAEPSPIFLGFVDGYEGHVHTTGEEAYWTLLPWIDWRMVNLGGRLWSRARQVHRVFCWFAIRCFRNLWADSHCSKHSWKSLRTIGVHVQGASRHSHFAGAVAQASPCIPPL